MEFRLTNTFVRNLKLEHLDDEPSEEANDLKYAPVYRDDKPREFAVVFDLRQQMKPDGLLTLQFLAVFETSSDITQENRKSHFPKVNAPAVAYPYLRAFVSQFSALAGCQTHTLPIRNFIKAAPPPKEVGGEGKEETSH
jgi:preprotein translocase subunit SecB